MNLKDLRSVVDEQTQVKVFVNSGQDSAHSGEIWFFTVDKSIDDLEVKKLVPKKDLLEITLTCSPATLMDTNWDNVFNGDAIVSMREDATDILS